MLKGNSFIVKGYVVKNAEVKEIPEYERFVVSFTVAWNKPISNKTPEKDDTASFFYFQTRFLTVEQVNAIAGKLVKGVCVTVSDAHIEQDRWMDAEGNNRSAYKFIVDDAFNGITVEILPKKEQKQVDFPEPPSQPPQEFNPVINQQTIF